MKAILTRKWAIPMLTLLLAFAGIGGAKAQVTETTSTDNAQIHIYLRFTDMAEVHNLQIDYRINGQLYTVLNTNYQERYFFGKKFYDIVINAPVEKDPSTDRFRLKYKVEIRDGYLRWREGLLAGDHSNANNMEFYGDTFIYVEQTHTGLGLIRRDYATIDSDMEESIMYSYDKKTGLSKMLETDPYTGTCSIEIDTQTFRHVNQDEAEGLSDPYNYQGYNMDNYPYETQLLLVRKSGYHSYKFINRWGDETGDGNQQLVIENNPDILYMTHGTTPTVVFNEFSESEIATEQAWQTPATGSAPDYSVEVYSYYDYDDETNRNQFDGFVGHLKITIAPRGDTPSERTWKTEAWLEHKNNNPDGWATLSTPYNVKVPRGLLILTVHEVIKQEVGTVGQEGYNPGRIEMVSMIDKEYIPAGTGVLAKGRGVFELHPYTGTMNGYDDDNNMQFVPLTQINNLPYDSEGKTHYVFTYDDDLEKPKFVRAISTNRDNATGWADDSSTGRIPPFKSYLKITSSDVTGTPARELIAVMADDASGITPTAISTANVSNAVYDITGRRYDAQSNTLKPGIYVVNGRKYVVR